MKTLQKLCAAVILTLAVAVSALANDGIINCPPVVQPPPPASATAEGQVGCPPVAQSILLTLETVFLLG